MKREKKGNTNTVSTAEKLGFMSFSASSNIVINFRSTYYKYFLTAVLLIEPIAASNMLLISAVWSAVSMPVLGVWASNIRFRSGEKIRPWLIWIALPFALGLVLMFCDFGVSERTDIILGLVILVLFETVNTLRGIPYNGMGALASADDGERKAINGFRSLGTCIGSGIGTVAVPAIIKAFGGLRDHSVINSGDSRAMFRCACLMGILIASGCLVHYFTTEERVRQVSGSEERIGFLEGYRMLFRCRSWVKNLIYVMFHSASTCLMSSAVTYHAAYVLNDSSLSAPIMLCYLVFAVIFSVITPGIDSLLGRRKTMILAGLILIAGKIPFILDPASVICSAIDSATAGMGLTMTFIIMNTNRNNISDIVELQNGRRLDAIVSTSDNLMYKIAEAFSDKLFLLALAAAGFDASLAEQGMMQNQATQGTINALLGWIPALFGLAILLISFAIDTRREYDEAAAAAEKTQKQI